MTCHHTETNVVFYRGISSELHFKRVVCPESHTIVLNIYYIIYNIYFVEEEVVSKYLFLFRLLPVSTKKQRNLG